MYWSGYKLRRLGFIVLALIFVLIIQACKVGEEPSDDESENVPPKEEAAPKEEDQPDVNQREVEETTINYDLDLSPFEREPSQWGENVDGVKTKMDTDEQQIALTFDACGGPYGNGYDEELITYLLEAQIPATLFVNQRWIDENEELFLMLADEPLFQIENHGTQHVPLSVNGGTAWGIEATESPKEAQQEVLGNHKRVYKLTGKEMSLFRSGTAYYDEVAVSLVEALGYEVVNFDILGDAGATFSKEQVTNALLQAQPGSIALLHMNQPQSGTAGGVKEAVPLLKEQGFEFVQLQDVELK
jgi:peptidoglycan/xylan/chitin deacetylase (PgdA/CDA1 family)